VGQTLEATLLTPLNIPPLGYGWVYYFLSRLPKNHKQYEIMISDYPVCNYMDFSSMIISPFGKEGLWVPCKHLYSILQYAMYSRIRKPLIHYPSWS